MDAIPFPAIHVSCQEVRSFALAITGIETFLLWFLPLEEGSEKAVAVLVAPSPFSVHLCRSCAPRKNVACAWPVYLLVYLL